MTERCERAGPLVVSLLVLLGGSRVSAQQSAVERCRDAGSDAERIACLERALTGGESKSPAVAVEQPPSGPAPSGIGGEQVRARNETAAEREARLAAARSLRVASYREVPYQRLQVELENGQVWRQIKGDTQHVRVDLERNRTVDIEESTLGGYKLRLNEIRRTIRVERVE